MVEAEGAWPALEAVNSGGVDGRGSAAFMANGTLLFRRKQAIRRRLAVSRRTVTVVAGCIGLLQMETVREVQFLRESMALTGGQQQRREHEPAKHRQP